MDVLEAAAEKLQAALLASLEEEKPNAQQQAKLKRKKDKKARRAKKCSGEPEPGDSQGESSCAPPTSSASTTAPPIHGEDAVRHLATSLESTAEQHTCIGCVAEEGPLAGDRAVAAAEAKHGEASTSSREGERPSDAGLGLASESTSENEWKVRVPPMS